MKCLIDDCQDPNCGLAGCLRPYKENVVIYMHIEEARKKGFTIDYSAAGRPVAYKGPRFQPKEWANCHTELETKLLKLVENAKQAVKYEGHDSPSVDRAMWELWLDEARKLKP